MRRSHRHPRHPPAPQLLVPLIILIASSSKEFSSNYRYSTCHAFGFSRPLSLPSWLQRTQRKTNMTVKTEAEPEVYMEVSVTDALANGGEKINEKNGQQTMQPASPSCADGLPILPIDELKLQKPSSSSSSAEVLPSSPPLTFEKYMTMTSKPVPVEIRYNSQQGGLRPFFLTVAKKIKANYPDVVVRKTDLATAGGGETPGDSMVFEVLVDGRPVVGKAETKRQSVSRSDSSGGSSSSSSASSGGKGGGDGSQQPVDLANGISVYVSMGEIDAAITKARRKRRPSTTYSQQGEDMGREGVSAIRLEVLRSRQQRADN